MRPRCDVGNEDVARASRDSQAVSRAATITPPHQDDHDDAVVDGVGVSSVDETRTAMVDRPTNGP